MNVTFCETCGASNQKTLETTVDKLTVKVLNMGSDNGSFEVSTEACLNCRKILMDTIKDLFTSKIKDINVILNKKEV